MQKVGRTYHAHLAQAGVRVNADLTVTPMVSSDLRTWGRGVVELRSREVSQAGVPPGFKRRVWEVRDSKPEFFVRWEVTLDDDDRRGR